MLVRPDSPPFALWLSSSHAARIADKYVATLIGATTLSTIGVTWLDALAVKTAVGLRETGKQSSISLRKPSGKSFQGAKRWSRRRLGQALQVPSTIAAHSHSTPRLNRSDLSRDCSAPT